MLNPRDVYIRAVLNCTKASKVTFTDYFRTYTIDPSCNEERIILYNKSGLSSDVKNLIKLIEKDTANEHLKAAYELFCDFETRVGIEGLLFAKSTEDILKIKDISKGVLDAYSTYFFNPTGLDSYDKKLLFSSLIISKEALAWFQTCLVKSTDELAFMLSGTNGALSEDALRDLKTIRARAISNYLTFGSFPADALTRGLSASEKAVILLAQKEAALAIKATQVELGTNDLAEAMKKFFKELKTLAIEDDSSQYSAFGGHEANMTEEQRKALELELQKKLNAVSPLSRVEASDLPEDRLDSSD
jgi:hypothetical protein